MNPDRLLSVMSLLALTLLSLHLTDDIVRGFEPGGLNNLIGVAILVVWLYAILRLDGRRSGYIVLVLGSAFAALMPVLHLSGAGVGGKIAASEGGFFFIWTVMALGVSGTFSLILSAQGLWRSRRRTTVA